MTPKENLECGSPGGPNGLPAERLSAAMERYEDGDAWAVCIEEALPAVRCFCAFVRRCPAILTPERGMRVEVAGEAAAAGFELLPTVERTSLLYERSSDLFFKILHPRGLKGRLRSRLLNPSEQIFRLSVELAAKGIRVSRVDAYGMLRRQIPFFSTRRVEGRSLYDILIREKKPLTMDLYRKVVDGVAAVHRHGYCLGDAHLSHIFVADDEIAGFIDIDGMRRNASLRISRFAKDLAGLNHPLLPIPKDDRKRLVEYYTELMGIRDRKGFLKYVRHYAERRWKGSA